MKERYSKQAVNALKAAEKTAEGRSHNYVGTEHLLVGLLKETAGTGEESSASESKWILPS